MRYKPGKQYIYERADGVTYAREIGEPVHTRFEIGRDYNRTIQYELEIWRKILEKAEEDSALKEAIDKVKVLYYLTNDHGG